MANAWLDAFMQAQQYTALTYDDVTLVTQFADFLPQETDLRTKLTRHIALNVPFVSAAMDTVTEAPMAIAMALQGGIGIIHKNLDPPPSGTHVKRVKFYLNASWPSAHDAPRKHPSTSKCDQARKRLAVQLLPHLDEGRKWSARDGRELNYTANTHPPRCT